MIKNFIIWMVFSPFVLIAICLFPACVAVGLLSFVSGDIEPMRLLIRYFNDVTWHVARLGYCFSFIVCLAVWCFGDKPNV